MKFEYQKELVDALLKCSHIFNETDRQVLIASLPDNIRSTIDTSRNAKDAAWNLVDSVLQYSSLNELLDRLRFFDDAVSLPVQKVDRVYRAIILSEILDSVNIPTDKLKVFYQKSCPYGIQPSALNQLWSIILHLSDMPVEPNTTNFPLLVFVERLIRYFIGVNNLVSNQLKDWLEKTVDHLSADLNQIRVAVDAKPDHLAENSESRLLVEIRPTDHVSGVDQKRYYIRILLWQNKDKAEVWSQDYRPKPLTDIPNFLTKTISSQPDVPEMIEFFLPHDLISYEIDHWPIQHETAVFTKYYGRVYKIVVRSLDRINLIREGHPSRKDWKKRWERFNQAFISECVQLLCDEYEYEEPASLYEFLETSVQIACIMMAFKPKLVSSTATNDDMQDHMAALIENGIPVALWVRQSADLTPPARDCIEAIKNGCDLHHLPEVVKQERLKAKMNCSTDFGHHLTLMWDDPDCVPVEILEDDPRNKVMRRLSMPNQRR